MDKLSTRVMALEGPDREVDHLMHTAIGYRQELPTSPARLPEVPRWIGLDGEPTGWVVHPQQEYPPRYTASLDAAMSLVPEGIWHEIKGPRRYLNIPTASPNYWSARLEAWDADADVIGWAATPALALCAAALKARGL